MRYAALILILLAGAANSQERTTYDILDDLKVEISLVLFEKYANRWRVQAILEACGKQGIAAALTEQDYNDVVSSEMTRLVFDSEATYPELRNASEGEMGGVIMALDAIPRAYRLGVQDGMRMLIKLYPKDSDTHCQQAMTMANDVLAEDR